MSNIIYEQDKIFEAASYILRHSDTRLLCFHGDMGMGKTTLIRALVERLGGENTANSPTFGLVHEYRDPKGLLLAYHLDCYRIKDEEEALDFGVEEYLEADCWVFVEWAENIESLLPASRTEIHISLEGPETRRLAIQNHS